MSAPASVRHQRKLMQLLCLIHMTSVRSTVRVVRLRVRLYVYVYVYVHC